MASRLTGKRTEIKNCDLCGTGTNKLKDVKYGNRRKRLSVCEKCWNSYYKAEAECEKINILERLGIIAERERDMATSGRKWRNLLYSFGTIIIIWVLGRIMLSKILAGSIFGIGYYGISEAMMDKMGSWINVLGAILAGYCLLLIVARLVLLLLKNE